MRSSPGAAVGPGRELSGAPGEISGSASSGKGPSPRPAQGASELRTGLVCSRAEDWLPTVADGSVQLIIVDPPYFRVMAEAWDRQWRTTAEYLGWLGGLADEWRRVLAPNGSLYVFASPEMAARVEVLVIGERFEVLNSITWPKPDSINRRAEREAQRSYLCQSERIIFAEHRGADSMALGESGWAAQCEELRGFVFEPLRAYLAGERDRSGYSNAEINAEWCRFRGVDSTSQTQKWFSDSCFNPPTSEAYRWLRRLFGSGFFTREYEDLRREYEDLRREYEDLRREYEDLRRPFTVSADVPHTDVFTYPTVEQEAGRHECEKPLPMLRDMINASSRPGDFVLDCCSGRGSTWAACIDTGREFTGCEMDPGWVRKAEERAERHRAIRERRPINGKRVAGRVSGPLFDGA